MNQYSQEDRAQYLKKNFPRPVSREWHSPGPFAEEVFSLFEEPTHVRLKSSGTRYINVDALELIGNPHHEEIRFRFRLSTERPFERKLKWGKMSEPLIGTTDPVYYFSFSSNLPVSKNVENIKIFVAEQLDDELLEDELNLISEKSEAKYLQASAANKSLTSLGARSTSYEVRPSVGATFLLELPLFLGEIGCVALAFMQAFFHIYLYALIFWGLAFASYVIRARLRIVIQVMEEKIRAERERRFQDLR